MTKKKDLSELFKREPKKKRNVIYLRLTDEDLEFVSRLMTEYDVPYQSDVIRILLQDRIRQIKEGK